MNFKFLIPLFFTFQVAHAQNPFIRHMYTAEEVIPTMTGVKKIE